MAGLKFLNPHVKLLVCGAGMALMGFFLYEASNEGALSDGKNLLRAAVFAAFAYFFLTNLIQVFKNRGNPPEI